MSRKFRPLSQICNCGMSIFLRGQLDYYRLYIYGVRRRRRREPLRLLIVPLFHLLMFANVTDDGESSGINFNVAATAALKTSFNVARARERRTAAANATILLEQ